MEEVFRSLIDKADSLPDNYRGEENRAGRWHCANDHYSHTGIRCSFCGISQRETAQIQARKLRHWGFIA